MTTVSKDTGNICGDFMCYKETQGREGEGEIGWHPGRPLGEGTIGAETWRQGGPEPSSA